MGRKQESRFLVVVHHRQSSIHPSTAAAGHSRHCCLKRTIDFFPSHYLTKFAVVATHSSSGSQSVSQFVVEEYRAVGLLKTRKKLPPRRINWGRCGAFASSATHGCPHCCVMHALSAYNMISFRVSFVTPPRLAAAPSRSNCFRCGRRRRR